MKVLADVSLPGLLQAFPKPFELTFYKQPEEIPKLLKGQEILLCRSTLKVNETLLKGQALKYVASASSGTDHIDASYLQKNAIELIDARGSNAISVADYVIATLAFLQKYKGFSGTKAGVIGIGEVGSQVVKRLIAAGMEVFCYDPPKKELDSTFFSSSLEALTQCDLIAVHANLHDQLPYPSRNLLDEAFLSQLKSEAVIINASRGGLVNEEALLKQKKHLIYCTDVYNNEPRINGKIVDFATLCTPHIAGHSIEAKFKAITMLSQKLHAHYHLRLPTDIPSVINDLTVLPANRSWQEAVLSLYNPVDETNLLKASDNLELTFLKLRKAHQNRHDFNSYDAHLTCEQTKKILGLV